MLRALFSKSSQIRQRLTRLEGQPLGQAALMVIIFLDLFILSSLFQGLDAQTRQLVSPEERIPSLCQEIVVDQAWDVGNRLEHLARLQHSALHLQDTLLKEHPHLHPLCRPLIQGLSLIHGNPELAAKLDELSRLNGETANLRARLEQMKGAYDTRLLERIAREPAATGSLEAMRQETAQLTERMEEIAARMAELRQDLEEASDIQRFFRQLQALGSTERTQLIQARQQLYFWQPVQRLGMEMLFLLPLLGVFYFWNSRSLARNRPYQTLVSAHLLAVTMVPVLFELLRLVYDILPHKLIRHLIELLEALKLVALWHYLMIALGVVLALALIYLFQKKLFSQERLMQRRIAKGECHACGLHLPAGSRHCPGCGTGQYRTCPHCQQATLIHGRFCTVCGRAVD